MGVTREKIQVDVEMTTEGAVSKAKKFTDAVQKSRKAVEDESKALRAAGQEFKVQQARLKNAVIRQEAFLKAAQRTDLGLSILKKRLKETGGGFREFAKKVAKVAGKIRNVTDVIKTVVTGIGAAANMTVELAQESLAAQNVFKNLPFSLNAARRSTAGLADDMTLARNAIMANQAGVATTGKAYGELVEVAQTLALKMGRDVPETVERVTQGIAKQEREILDELVVLPKLNDVMAEFAEANDVTVDKLTSAQRQTAFTESALKALREATKGVSTDMDGAAGAISRTVVQLKNAKTQLLGGKEQALSLRRGLLSLDDANLRLAAHVGEYGSNQIFVNEALQDAGVNTKKLAKGNLDLEKQINKVLVAEGKRLGRAADHNEITEEGVVLADRLMNAGIEISEVNQRMINRNRVRLGISKEQLEVQKQLAEEEVEHRRDLEAGLAGTRDSIALARARGETQAEINSLRSLELEIQAQILEADGELEKAAKTRRKSELARIKARAPTGGRGRGRRKDDAAEERLKRLQDASRREVAHFERINALEIGLAKFRRDRLAELDPFSPDNVEAQLSNVIDLSERRAKIDVDQRMRAIEELRAAGVEPIELAKLEADAKIRGIRDVAAAKDAAIERELQLAVLTGDTAEAAALKDERRITAAESLNEIEGALHDEQMTRIQEQGQAEEKSLKRRQDLVKSSSDLWIGAAETVARSVIIEGKSLQKAVAGTAKKLAMEHGILAVSEGLKALSALASFNVIQAAAHGTAAAEHAAFAVGMGAIAGIAGGAGGGGGGSVGVSGALGASAFGGGDAANGPPGGSSSGGGGDSGLGGEVPISPTGEALDTSGQAASQAGGASVNVVQNITVNTMGTPNEESVQALAKANRKAGNRLGRLAVGS